MYKINKDSLLQREKEEKVCCSRFSATFFYLDRTACDAAEWLPRNGLTCSKRVSCLGEGSLLKAAQSATLRFSRGILEGRQRTIVELLKFQRSFQRLDSKV